MPRYLQFSFLGCHNSYLASVTYANPSGWIYEPPIIAYSGFPHTFIENYHKFAGNKYIYNIRGHDCFALLGSWTRETGKGHMQESKEMLAEIDTLNTLARANVTNNPPYNEEDLLLSLGPTPGSFFADAYRLRQYRWSQLPIDLDNEIQRELGRKGYGTIYDVTLNSAGGWVLQLDKGKSYKWGGSLPEELVSALFEGRENRKTIRQLYLNHQNADDYVLIFTDASVHVSLHSGFEQPLRELIESTFSESTFFKRKKLKWKFTASCFCNENAQLQINAAYYNQRGHFQFNRSNFDQALKYMREAHNMDYSNVEFWNDYRMALLAVRREDPTPEEYLMRFDTTNRSAFRNEYAMMMRDMMGNVAVLEERIRERQRQAQQQGPPGEWKYRDPTPLVMELPAITSGTPLYELMDHDDSSTVVSDMLSLREPSKRSLLFWR